MTDISKNENKMYDTLLYLISTDQLDNRNKILCTAARNGYLEVVKLIIDAGADVNVDNIKYITVYGDIYKHNYTPLTRAAINGHLAVVQYLVDHGAKVNLEYSDALDVIRNGHFDIIKYLVAQGSTDFDKKDYAAAEAAIKGHLEIFFYLLDKGADISPYKTFIFREMVKNA